MSYSIENIQHRGAHSVSLRPYITKILIVILWVLGLWVWGSALKGTSHTLKLVLLMGSLVPGSVLFWRLPEYGIIALIFFASGFLSPDFVDLRLPIGGGLEMRDIMLLVMLGLTMFKQPVGKSLKLPLFPVGALLALFLLLAVFSLFNALFFENVINHWALSDARILSFYSIAFIIAWGITTKNALFTVVVGILVIADITSIIVFIQQSLGPDDYLLNSMNHGSWQVWRATGGVRVVPPGIVLMYFAHLIAIGLALMGNFKLIVRLFLIMQSLFLGVALLLTFTRSAWIATFIAFAIMLPFVLFAYQRYIAQVAILGSAFLLTVFGVGGLAFDEISPDNGAATGILQRATSIFELESAITSNSLQWRLFEYQEGMKAIREQPLTGVSLGNSYRSITVFQGEAQGRLTDGDISSGEIDRFTRYVHNSYLAVAVKLGIPGLFLIMAFLGAAIYKSFSLFAQLPNFTSRGIVLAVGAGLIGLLQWSILHVNLMLALSTAVIGLVVGLLAAIHIIYSGSSETH